MPASQNICFIMKFNIKMIHQATCHQKMNNPKRCPITKSPFTKWFTMTIPIANRTFKKYTIIKITLSKCTILNKCAAIL